MLATPEHYEVLSSGILTVYKTRHKQYTIKFHRIAALDLPDMYEYKHLDDMPPEFLRDIRSVKYKIENTGSEFDFVGHRDKHLLYKKNRVDFKSYAFAEYRAILSRLTRSNVIVSFVRSGSQKNEFLIIGQELLFSKQITCEANSSDKDDWKLIAEQLDRFRTIIVDNTMDSVLNEYPDVFALNEIFWLDGQGRITFSDPPKNHPHLVEIDSKLVYSLVNSLRPTLEPSVQIDSLGLVTTTDENPNDWILFATGDELQKLRTGRYLIAGSEATINSWITNIVGFKANASARKRKRILVLGSKRPMGFRILELENFRFDLLQFMNEFPQEYYLPVLQVLEKIYGLKGFTDDVLEIWYNMDPELRKSLDWENFYYKVTANNSYDLLPGHGDRLLFNVAAGFSQFTQSEVFAEYDYFELPDLAFIDTSGCNLQDLVIQLYCLHLRTEVDAELFDLIIVNDQNLTGEMLKMVLEDLMEKVFRDVTLLLRTTRHVDNQEASFDMIILENNDFLIRDLMAETKFADYRQMIFSGNPLFITQGNNPIYLDLIHTSEVDYELLSELEVDVQVQDDVETISNDAAEENAKSRVEGDTETTDDLDQSINDPSVVISKRKRNVLRRLASKFRRSRSGEKQSSREVDENDRIEEPVTSPKNEGIEDDKVDEWTSPTIEAKRNNKTSRFVSFGNITEEILKPNLPLAADAREDVDTDQSETPVDFQVEFDRLYVKYGEVMEIEKFVSLWLSKKERLSYREKLDTISNQYNWVITAIILHEIGDNLRFDNVHEEIQKVIPLNTDELTIILDELVSKKHIEQFKTKTQQTDVITLTAIGREFKRFIYERMRNIEIKLEGKIAIDRLLVHYAALNERLRTQSVYHQVVGLIRWIQVLNYLHWKRIGTLEPRLAMLEGALRIEEPLDDVEEFLQEMTVQYVPIIHEISTKIMSIGIPESSVREMTQTELDQMPTIANSDDKTDEGLVLELEPVIVPKLSKLQDKPKKTKKQVLDITPTIDSKVLESSFEMRKSEKGQLSTPVKFKKEKRPKAKKRGKHEIVYFDEPKQFSSKEISLAIEHLSQLRRPKSSKRFYVLQSSLDHNKEVTTSLDSLPGIIGGLSIEDLAIDRRFKKLFTLHKIVTIKDLITSTMDFSSIRGVGEKTHQTITSIQAMIQHTTDPTQVQIILNDEGVFELHKLLGKELQVDHQERSRSVLIPFRSSQLTELSKNIHAAQSPLEVGVVAINFLLQKLGIKGNTSSFDGKCNLLRQYQTKNHALLLKNEVVDNQIIEDPTLEHLDLLWVMSGENRYQEDQSLDIAEIKEMVMSDIRRVRYHPSNFYEKSKQTKSHLVLKDDEQKLDRQKRNVVA